MEFSQKIYKLDSAQRERVLHIYTDGAKLIQESGLVDGAKIPHEKICKGKNIGKANETTPEQQSVLQARSKLAEKLSEGYFMTLEEAKSTEVVMPMLAEDYKKHSSKIKWVNQVFIQPKLDGMRCHIIVDKGKIRLMSRAGKEILTMQHIIDAIIPALSPTSKFILDGELYAHGLTFQENMRLLKKVRPGETEKIGFHMYDVVSSTPFIARYNFAKAVVDKIKSPLITLVETVQIGSETDLLVDYKKFLAAGYEGAMIRHSDTGYESNKRSVNLLKYKEFQDVALPIIDVLPSDAKPDQGVLLCKLPNGLECKASLKFSHEERANILLNKNDYIGKQTAEIRYFENTEDGNLRFPVCIGFRLDK